MAIDPSIPLQGQGPPPITLNSIAQISQMMRQSKADQQQQQARNALLNIYRTPGALDANGMPTQDAIKQISAISPEMGMDIRMNESKLSAENALGQQRKIDAYKTKAEAIQNATDPALLAHDQAIANGLPPQQAMQLGQKAYNENLQSLKQSGLFSEQELQQMPNNFDPNRVRAGAIKYKDWLSANRADKSQDIAQQRFDLSEKNADRRFEIEQARLADSERRAAVAQEGAGASLSPAAIKAAAARYNIDGTLPPLGMGKQASGVRDSILDLAAEMNSGIDPSQQRLNQLQGKSDAAARAASTKAFSTGPQGNAVRSLNVSMNHLDTLSSLSDALGNNDVNLINKLANRWSSEVGGTAPVNFDAAKQIVADEIVKGIVGAGGTGADREKAQASIDASRSPQQLKGVIHTYKELLGGQLKGLQGQYEAGTGKKDFDKYLSGSSKSLEGKTTPNTGDVVKGYRFKGGDPSQQSNWEKQ